MSKLHYNKQKFRYEGRTSDGRWFAVDESLIKQYQLDDLKEGGTGYLTPALLESSHWEKQIDKNRWVFYIDPLLEQITEAEQVQHGKERKEQEMLARKAKRAEIKSYLLEHPHADNRLTAETLGTTIFQVRRVRREMEQANG